MKFTVSAAAVALLAACSVNAVAAPEPVITPAVERRQGALSSLAGSVIGDVTSGGLASAASSAVLGGSSEGASASSSGGGVLSSAR